MDPSKIAELKKFVEAVDANPVIIHLPELAFFKSYLTKMGCTKLPPMPNMGGGCCDPNTGKCSKPKAEEKAKEPEAPEGKKEDKKAPVDSEASSEEEEVEEEEIEEVASEDEEDPLKLSPEEESLPPTCSDCTTELNDDELDKQGALKQEAAEAAEDGDLQKGIEVFTKAIEMGNCTAMMFTKRADWLLKSKRPLAAVADCDKALELNPDSAKAYRIRGMANRRMHRWDPAHADLEQAQRLDFDDDTEDARKLVQEKWKKYEKVRVAKRLREERIVEKKKVAEQKRRLKERKKALKKAEEERKRQEEAEKEMGGGFPGGMPGGFPGMPGGFPGKGAGKGGKPGGMPGGFPGMPGGMGGAGGMPDIGGLMSDPEIAAAMSNPKVMNALMEMMSGVQSGDMSVLMKYQSDPEVGPVLMKMMAKMGGGMGMPGGMPGGMGGAGMSSSAPAEPEEDGAHESGVDVDKIEECD